MAGHYLERHDEEQNCLLQFELAVPMIRIVFQLSPIRIEKPNRVEPESDVTTRSKLRFHDRVSTQPIQFEPWKHSECQGFTLNSAVIDLRPHVRCVGLSFVAVSKKTLTCG